MILYNASWKFNLKWPVTGSSKYLNNVIMSADPKMIKFLKKAHLCILLQK